MAPGGAVGGAVVDDTPTLQPGAAPPRISEEDEQIQLQRDLFFMSRRTAGDQQLDNQQAGALRRPRRGPRPASQNRGAQSGPGDVHRLLDAASGRIRSSR